MKKKIAILPFFLMALCGLASCGPNNGIEEKPEKVGDKLIYGYFPQTHVAQRELVESLNALKSEDANEFGYYLFEGEYYMKTVGAPSADGFRFDDGMEIVTGLTYWFKVEPIEWKILQEENNEYFLTTDVLLAGHMFNEKYEGQRERSDIDGKTANVCSNNYQFSEIRRYLNTDFLNRAFFKGNSYILTTEVDNSLESTLDDFNPYVSENTNDKVFLLSQKEIMDSSLGFSSDEDRICLTTDYARATGATINASKEKSTNGFYYLRSPDNFRSSQVHAVFYDGSALSATGVSYDSLAIRPAIKVKL